MSELILAGSLSIGGLVGLAIGYFLRTTFAKAKVNSAETKADQIVAEAKNKEKELLLKAKEKAIGLIDEAKKEEQTQRGELNKVREHLEKRENMFDQKLLEFEESKQKLATKVQEVQGIKEKINELRDQAISKLEKVASMSKDEAKDELLTKVEEQSKLDLHSRIKKMEQTGIETLEEKARQIVIETMQRCASNHSNENSATVVSLPSDEMKGRIIGKDGRNIKTIEKMTGCELVIDDTPNMLVISGFSPIRRRVCQLALEKLIKDGRIQPAKIEEYIEIAKKELALDIKKAGEDACYEMGLTGLDPKLVSIIGRLKYRTSYGQNVLKHCLEVGHIAGMMADELGLDPHHAKKAGFFHDIGKAIDHETEGAHTEVGERILKKFNMHEDFQEVALNHHETNPESLLVKLVMAADAISASRMGARRDTFEQYVARLEELEKTASDFPGIDKVYAIQAGREVRVFVKPDAVDDYTAYNLARDIARKIENELTYPGEIKVNVIRETRTIEFAK